MNQRKKLMSNNININVTQSWHVPRGYEIKGRSFHRGFVCLFLAQVRVHFTFLSESNQTVHGFWPRTVISVSDNVLVNLSQGHSC